MSDLPHDLVIGQRGHRKWHESIHRLLDVQQISLNRAVVSTLQEGGNSVSLGTFTPLVDEVYLEIDIAGQSSSYAGHGFVLNIGVLPTVPPTPWEVSPMPSRITKADWESNTPLPGVTEYQQFSIGLMPPDVSGSKLTKNVVLSGLTPGRTYQWEIRCGGNSGAKRFSPRANTSPSVIAVEPHASWTDPQYVWVGYTGPVSRVVLFHTGQRQIHQYWDDSLKLYPVAEIILPSNGSPSSLRLQPNGNYLATLDTISGNLCIIDRNKLALVGSYAIPNGDTSLGLAWTADGTKLWVGTFTAGKLYRFDAATLAFDGTSVTGAAASAAIPFCTTHDGSALLYADFFANKLMKMPLSTNIPVQFGPTLGHPGPNDVAVRNDNCIVHISAGDDKIVCLNTDGSVKSTMILPPSGVNQAAHVALSADQSQVYWTNDAWYGWAWMDTGQLINNPNLASVYGLSGIAGEIVGTDDDAILLCVPPGPFLQMWPGGTFRCDPTSPFSADHIDVTFHGAQATFG